MYKELRDCGIKPHEQNNEFCVFNCTFIRQTDSLNNSQNKGVICNELCIPLGIVQKLHLNTIFITIPYNIYMIIIRIILIDVTFEPLFQIRKKV